MMKNIILLSFTLFIAFSGVCQTAFKIYSKSGKEVTLAEIAKKGAKYDVILFGELHTNPICHWLQLRLTQQLFSQDSVLTMGAEMFESDNQLLMNEYLNGTIREKDFEKEARLWNNYKTDYKPLVQFAKQYEIKFVATNIPRRYAALVNKKDLDSLQSLSAEAKAFIAPLPMAFDTNNPSVEKMLHMDFGHGMGMASLEKMLHAQAIKDATMAHFIYSQRTEKVPFIHFHGDFHSSNFGGIYWYLKDLDKKLKIQVISTVEGQGDLPFKEEYAQLGDYILVVASDMTQTSR